MHPKKEFMKKNLGTIDRLARLIISALLFTFYFSEVPEGAIKWIVLALAAIMFLTALIGVCPLYAIFGFSSLNKKVNDRVL